MKLSEAIKRYNLQRQYKDFLGDKYPEKHIHYHSEKDTPAAHYEYHADNEFSEDLGDGKTFILDIQRVSKTVIKENGLPLITGSTIELERE